jgi:hypothetical protein
MPQAAKSPMFIYFARTSSTCPLICDGLTKCSTTSRNDHTKVLWTGNGRLKDQLIRRHLSLNLNLNQDKIVGFTSRPEWRKLTTISGSFESPQPASSFIGSSTPAPAFRNPSFTTPRKPFDQDLFSEVSGADDSPAENADAEDTPDTKTSTAMAAFTLSNSEKQPLFGRYGAGFLGNSPGRADHRRGKYGNAIVNKVRKRKRIDRDHALALGTRRGSTSDSEDEDAERPRMQHLHSNSKQNWLSGFLNGIESRPNLPNILSYYAQLGVNFFIAALTVYGVYSFWVTVRSDVDKASEEAMASVLSEMAACAREFTNNGCHKKDVLPPALVPVCENWDTCMKRDPASVGRAKISAHTFAQILNSFIEPISVKAMVCCHVRWLRS